MTFLNPKTNTYLSKLPPSDINHLLWEISNFYIPSRPNLNLEHNIFFGTELEYGDANQALVTKRINELIKERYLHKDWISKDDTTVHNIIDNVIYGGEVTSPKCEDTSKTWQEISLVCAHLSTLGAIITDKASLHIHVDQSILGTNHKAWLNFIKLWIIYEEVIYRFCYGEYPTSRKNMKKHFNPVRRKYLELFKLYNLNTCQDVDTLLSRLKITKYFGINFMNTNYTYTEELSLTPKKNTIELRVSNGTLEPTIIQNIVYFFIKLLLASHTINEDFLDQKLANLSLYQEEDFDNIHVYDALELADLIYDNNFDKFCFLRQYIKSYEIASEFKKVSRFTL